MVCRRPRSTRREYEPWSPETKRGEVPCAFCSSREPAIAFRCRKRIARSSRRSSASLELRVLASAADPDLPDDDTFHLVKPVRPRVVDGAAFHLSLPMRVARELRGFRPDAVLVQGAHEPRRFCSARRLARVDARIVSTCTATGAPRRGSTGRAPRRCSSRSSTCSPGVGVRRADGVRTLSELHDRPRARGRRRAASPSSPPSSTSASFLDRAAAAAARAAARRSSSACSSATRASTCSRRRGRAAAPRARRRARASSATARAATVVERFVARLPSRRTLDAAPRQAEVAPRARRLDVLVLPVRSEGLGRVVHRGVLPRPRRRRRRAPAASPTSSRTARTASSSSPATRTRSPTRSSRVLSRPRARGAARRRGRAQRVRGLARDARGVRRARCATLVDARVLDCPRARRAGSSSS